MKSIFFPAICLMDRLRYPLKFGLIFLVVLVPLILSSVNLVSSANDEMETLRNERQGLRYIQAVRLLVEPLQQHRGLESAYLNGSEDFRARMMSKRPEADRYFAELSGLDTAMAGVFNMEARISAVRKQWHDIKAISPEQDDAIAVSLSSHNDLLASLIDMMGRVASASEITLDPELDSYYLGTVLASNLINLTENMGQARAVGVGIASKGRHTGQSLVRLSVLSNNIDLYAKHSRAGLNIAVEANDRVGVALRSAVTAHNRAVSDVQLLLQSILGDTDRITISSQAVYDAATLAITDSYGLYDAIAEALDELYLDRIASASHVRTLTIIVVSMVLLAVIYLFAGLYLSVVQSVNLIGLTTRHIARGDLGARLMLKSRDELQQVSIDFNAMAEARQRSDQQVREMLEASIREITKRSAIEQALREQMQRNKLFLQNTYDGYLLISPEQGRLLEVNDSVCNMLRYDRKALLGMRISDLLPRVEAEEIAGNIERILARGNLCFEFNHQLSEGDTIDLDISATLADEGEQQVILAFCRDITARKRREQRRLQEVKVQRDVLVREVHHRIKNHLQGVINLLRNQAMDKPEIAPSMESAIGQVDSIAVVHGLQSQTTDNQIHLAALLQAICRAVGTRSAGIQLDMEPLASEVTIRAADAVPVALIINELVQNAVKHSALKGQNAAIPENKSIRIELSVRQATVELRLINPCTGTLPPGFDIAAGEGLGTGLALVKDLLPRQGARLNVYERDTRVFTELSLSDPVIRGTCLSPAQQQLC